MTRQLDAFQEQRQARADRKLVAALEFDLVKAVAHAGGILQGFSVRCGDGDSLVTLRAELSGRGQVAFVGAETVPDALRKAVREGYQDKLKWRQDQFST